MKHLFSHHKPLSSIASASTFLAVALMSNTALANNAEKSNTQKIEQMTAYLAQCQQVKKCNGSFLVIDQGKVLFEQAVGQNGDGTALTTSHKFDIGSVTKQFTATAIMLLKDKGLLTFDDKVAQHIPEFPYQDMTIRHLLTHSSGMPNLMRYFTQQYRQGKVKSPISNQTTIAVLATQKPKVHFAPGEKSEYSNTGYAVLASIVERLSGQSFHDFMKTQVFSPLGMNDTAVARVHNATHFNNNKALGYRESVEGKVSPYDQIPNYNIVGDGGIYSTTADLHKWSQAIMQRKLASEESWQAALTAATLNSGKEYPYGFGWKLKPSPTGQKNVGHSGHWRGFRATFEVYPDNQQAVIILTNSGLDDEVDETADAFEAIMQNQPYELHKPSVARAIFKAFSQGKPAADKLASELADNASKYDIKENELNRLGYQYLEKKQVDDAIWVLTFALENFQKSENAYDSLAEAHATKGDFAKSEQLMKDMASKFPKSANIDKRLQELKALAEKA